MVSLKSMTAASKQLLLPITLLLSACAPYASEITPAAISGLRYDGWSCAKLAKEKAFVDEALARTSADEDAAANRDAWMVFLIGVPTSGGGVKGASLAQRVHLRRVRRAAGLSTGGSTAGFRMCRLRAAAFGDRRDGLAPHPHAVAQMVRGSMADRARQARRVGSVPGARTGAALRHSLADGAQVAPRAERATGIPARWPDRDR